MRLINQIKKSKTTFSALRTNFYGKSVKKKYIIFESDDWGSIRTPSKSALEKINKISLKSSKTNYMYDALESEEDLDLLFNLLSKYKNAKGEHPKFTLNFIVANPDFNKIEESDYQKYNYELFTDTYKRYPKHSDNLKIIKKAINDKLAISQFHGREHLNIKRWMNSLKNNLDKTRLCFEYNSTSSGNGDYSFMEAFDWDTCDDVETHIKIIKEGLKIFSSIFN